MNYLTVFPKQVILDTPGKHTIFNLSLSVSDQTQRIQQLPQQEKSGFLLLLSHTTTLASSSESKSPKKDEVVIYTLRRVKEMVT